MVKMIHYLDYAKGIAIILVVLGHIFSGGNIKTYIYSFHMPLFFIISGYLFNYSNVKSFKEFINKKIKAYLIPYVTFSIINILGYYLLSGLSLIVLRNNLLETIKFCGIGALWFLPILFIAETIFMFCKFNNKKIIYSVLIFIGVSVISLSIWALTRSFIALILIRSMISLIFIIIGYSLCNVIKNLNLKWYQIAIITILNIALAVINGYVDLWGIQFNNIILYFINSILGSLNIISISKKINSKLLSFWGRNTLIIMATHQLILTMFSKINIVNELSFTTKLILVLVIEYPIIVLINNYTPFLLGKFKKKYKLSKEIIKDM